MEKKDLQQVDNEIVADEFAYNGTQYVVLDTSDAGDAKDMLVIMKAEMQEDETYVLTAIEEDEYEIITMIEDNLKEFNKSIWFINSSLK